MPPIEEEPIALGDYKVSQAIEISLRARKI